ncbi:MAG TPA: bifunctional pyr operon transcriptional regulator/uracil phosphoribosyltransferase PyrR [Burkholderiales bacterium]|nr:bifunctional pyr operon transcriptional regulator/uracil phosphoribosyltransferase PyrR [Burkholderiales bacterium]
MSIQLPEAEKLYQELLVQLRRGIHSDTAMVGIYTGGVWLAERLHKDLGLQHALGQIDISFYRDDFDQSGLKANLKRSHIPFDVAGRHILLVDDVLYTGRTVRGAMNELFDYGRPASIGLVVLVDRGERELPISAQYAAAKITVPKDSMLVLDRDTSGKLSLRFDNA